MNPNRSFPSILPTEQDASYYYLYGRSQLYRYLPEVTLSQPRPGPDNQYTLLNQRATGQGDEGPQTVEQLITRGYFAVPAADAETALISDKGWVENGEICNSFENNGLQRLPYLKHWQKLGGLKRNRRNPTESQSFFGIIPCNTVKTRNSD